MKNKSLFFLFIFLLSCLGQTGSDVYLPALPAIRSVFHTTTQIMQFSLAIYMLGFSVFHLIYGPLSDSVGRKKPLIIGMMICIAGLLLCRFAQNIEIFVVGRFLQGAGAAAGAALFLSILRDVYQGNTLAKISSFLGVTRVLLLASSPLIGSYLLDLFDWRACFTFLLIYALFCLIASITIFQETNRFTHLNKNDLVSIGKKICEILKNKTFIGYTFCVMFAFGGILAWLTTLPFLLQDLIGLTPIQFGWISALAGTFFIVGGFINAMVVERAGLQNMLYIGLWIMLMSAVALLGFGLEGTLNTFVIMTPICIYIIGSSMVFANAYAGAMHPFTFNAGTAAALFGFLQILGGAISSFCMSATKTYNQIPLSIALLLSAGLSIIILKLTQQTAHKTKL